MKKSGMVLGFLLFSGLLIGCKSYKITSENPEKIDLKNYREIIISCIDLETVEQKSKDVKKDSAYWDRKLTVSRAEQAIRQKLQDRKVEFLEKNTAEIPARGDLFVKISITDYSPGCMFLFSTITRDRMYFDIEMTDIKTKKVIYKSSVNAVSRGLTGDEEVHLSDRVRLIYEHLAEYLSDRFRG